jgi:hypothetical protein
VLPLCLVKAFHMEFNCLNLNIVNIKAFDVSSYANTLELYQNRYLYHLIRKHGKPFILVYISIHFWFFLFGSHATLSIMIHMILASLSHPTKLARLFWFYPVSNTVFLTDWGLLFLYSTSCSLLPVLYALNIHVHPRSFLLLYCTK